MIDIHNHSLFGLDDGPKDIDTSLKMLEIAKNDGIREIVLTPHIAEEFRYDINNAKEKFFILQEKIKEAGIDLKLHLGFEVRIDKEVLKKYEEKIEMLTVDGKSKYVLLEFPFLDIPLYYKEIIKYFTSADITPIIVHPFRNRKIFSNINFLDEIFSLGVLFQFNTDDILNKNILPVFIKVLKKNLVHFVASDAHSLDLRPPILSPSFKIVEKKFKENVAKTLFFENPQKIVNGEFFENRVLINSNFFGRIKNMFKKEEED